MIYLNLFYYFMILFQYNNIIILSLIIFLLNYNQHIIDIRYFKISQHHAWLSTSLFYENDICLLHMVRLVGRPCAGIVRTRARLAKNTADAGIRDDGAVQLHWKIISQHIDAFCYLSTANHMRC
jgi:hypothetical protein